MNFNLKKIPLEEVNAFLRKARIFLLASVLILLLSAAVFVYYKFVYQITTVQFELDAAAETVNQEALQDVLNELDSRQETLDRIRQGKYPDPFN